MVVAFSGAEVVGIAAVFLTGPDLCGDGWLDEHGSFVSILDESVVEFGDIDCLKHRVLTPAVWCLRDSSINCKALKLPLPDFM